MAWGRMNTARELLEVKGEVLETREYGCDSCAMSVCVFVGTDVGSFSKGSNLYSLIILLLLRSQELSP